MSNMTAVSFSTDFESGSIGKVVLVSEREWEFYLADDNGDTSLPEEYRTWWYVRADQVPTNAPVRFTIKNRGWPFYYVPVYSYDGNNWLRFDEVEVSQNEDDEIVVQTRFTSAQVWLARFYPYTYSDLEQFIEKVQSHAFVELEVPGYSQNGRPLYLLKITHPGFPTERKKKVFIHARTHPAETPGSYLVEGLVDTLLGASPEPQRILSTHEFYIFPIHNVDGVIAGNYRTTPKSENLEILWRFDPNDPLDLMEDTPAEVKVVHDYARRLMTDGGPPVTLALNLHASNSEPDTRPFFFPHFGTLQQGYAEIESDLWNKQLLFIDYVAKYYGADRLEPTPDEGGSEFVKGTYPESWWWANFENRVMAMTMEITYDRAGYAPNRITQENMRTIGEALVYAIRDYNEVAAESRMVPYAMRKKRIVGSLKYPELYPPNADNEGKQ